MFCDVLGSVVCSQLALSLPGISFGPTATLVRINRNAEDGWMDE